MAEAAASKTTEVQAELGLGSQEPSATDAGSQSTSAAEKPAEQPKAAKPDGLDDRFWDGEKNAVKFGDLNTALSELTAFKAEHDSKVASLPQSADDYKIELPPDFKLPDGVEFKIDDTNPILAEARTFAKEAGLTQDQFSKMLTFEAKRVAAEAAAVDDFVKKSAEALGPKGKERVDAVQTWLTARVGADLTKALWNNMYQADQIVAFEKIMAAFASAGQPGATQTGREGGKETALSEDEYKGMSFEERVHRARELGANRKKAAG